MPRIVAFLFVVACSSNEPPVIDDVAFGSFLPDANGDPSAFGSVTAHAPSGHPITQLAVRFDPESQNGITLWEGPPLDVAGLTSPYAVTFALRSGTPAGAYSMRVTATDSTGASSEPFTRTFRIE